jgi:MerR family transcriptional regulator, light-induced transcriptional regulator
MSAQNMEYYEISAVSRLTGISAHTLRVWERRYGVVEPVRSDSQRRHYDQTDIRRLTLLKTLTEHGSPISSVARLSLAELEDRVARAPVPAPPANAPLEQQRCRILAIGNFVRRTVAEAAMQSPMLEVVSYLNDFPAIKEMPERGSVDLLIVERSTLFPEELRLIREWMNRLGARRSIVIYHFAAERDLSPNDFQMITALRAPVQSNELVLACLAAIEIAARAGEPEGKNPANSPDQALRPGGEQAPPRRFSDGQLAHLSTLTSTVKCDCPQHLASILANLNAFERYSALCESRNEDDAALHAHLYQTTAKARISMEEALARLLSSEGIEL